jgi:hypothetical protein
MKCDKVSLHTPIGNARNKQVANHGDFQGDFRGPGIATGRLGCSIGYHHQQPAEYADAAGYTHKPSLLTWLALV